MRFITRTSFSLLAFFSFFFNLGNSIRAESPALLVYSRDGQVFSYDLSSGAQTYLLDWEGNYDYQIDGSATDNIYGGRITRNLTNELNSLEFGIFYREVQNPINQELFIRAFFSDEMNSGWLVLYNNGNEISRYRTTDLGVSHGLLPIGWLDAERLLVADFLPMGLRCSELYQFSLTDGSLTALEVDLPDINNAVLTSNQYEVISLSEENELIRVNLGYNNTTALGITADWIWGWLNLDQVENFKNRVIGTKIYEPEHSIQAVTPFLYWPVPSNHMIACDIGCYSGHVGIDIGVNTANTTPIYAAAGGIVVEVVNNQPYGYNRVTSPAYGNYVKIRHANGYYTKYGHMTTNIKVSVGQEVCAGTLIGYGSDSGNTCGTQPAATGCAGYAGTYYHLHFEVLGTCGTSACWVNPSSYWLTNANGSIKDATASGGCDTSAPTTTANLSGTNFGNGWYISPVTVMLQASDSGGSGLNHTAYDIDWVNPGSTRSWPYSFTYGQDGQHTLYYRSIDNAGNLETLKSLPLNIDQVAPTAPSSVNPGRAVVSDVWQNAVSNLNFTWSGASDVTSGVAGYQYYWGSDPSGTTTNWLSSAAYDPPSVTPGTYYLRLRSGDWAGNGSPWTTLFTFRYDTVAPSPPTLTSYGCANVYSWQNTCSTPEFFWNATDDLSGIAGYYVYWGPDSSGTTGVWTSSSQWTPGKVNDGAYNLLVQTVDNAGNKVINYKYMRGFRYDGTIPVASLKINGDDEETEQADVVLSLTASDNASGVFQVRYSNDGETWSNWQTYTSQQNWKLDKIPGLHTVYVEVIDNAMNIGRTQDTIRLQWLYSTYLPMLQR